MPAPATPYGASLLEVEAIAAGRRAPPRRRRCARCATRRSSARTCRARSAGCCGCPLVPVPAFADPPFSLLHPDDAAEAMVAAIERRYDGPLNVVGPGAATPWQAARLGGRVPLPVLPPFWAARRACQRGRGRRDRAARRRAAAARPHRLDGGRAIEALGLTNLRSTQEVLRELFEWANVVPDRRPRRGGGRMSSATVAERGRTTTGSTSTASSPSPSPLGSQTVAPAVSAAGTRSTRSGSTRSSPTSSRRSSLALVRVDVTGERAHPDATARAVLVANRGFGVVEPAALARRGAARDRPPPARRRRADRAVRRRAVPPARRDLRQRARPVDVRARRPPRRGPARADVVAHRRGHAAAAADAGDDARRPSIPVAVRPGGPFGTRSVRGACASVRPSRSTSRHDPGDPLGAARLAEAVRDAVGRTPRAAPETHRVPRGYGARGASRAGDTAPTDGVEDRVRRVGRARRHAVPADPGPRHRLRGLGAPARMRSAAGTAASPSTTAAPARRDAPRRAVRPRSRWPRTRSRCSTPKASSAPTSSARRWAA